MSLPVSQSALLPMRLKIRKTLNRRSNVSIGQIVRVMEENEKLKKENAHLHADLTISKEAKV